MSARPTVAAALSAAVPRLAAAGSETPRLDAEVLLASALGGSRTLLLTRRAETLDPAVDLRFAALLERRCRREPVAYLTGAKEFYSLSFAVDARVLIPRPETEGVVDAALAGLRERIAAAAAAAEPRPLRVLDVGTGSGAIAVALAHEIAAPARRRVAVLAVDLLPGCLEVARGNATRLLGCDAPRFLRGSLTAAIGAGTIDLLVSNPPYLSLDELAAAAPELGYEPVAALDGGGKDGTEVLRGLVTDAPRVLRPGGHLVSEIGSSQGEPVAALARSLGFDDVSVLPDLAGHDRVVTARWRRGVDG